MSCSVNRGSLFLPLLGDTHSFAGFFFFSFRNGDTYAQQAANCKNGGGFAAIIRNDEDWPLEASLGSFAGIPVIGVSKADGELLLDHSGEKVNLLAEDGYASISGTSFAAPFVTGAAAALLQSCPRCNNTQLYHCLQASALDLGRSDYYGSGLVQVEDTYQCLLNDLECCSGDATAASAGNAAPASPGIGCRAQEAAVHECYQTQLSDEYRGKCAACVNPFAPDNVSSRPCADIIGSVCWGLDYCNRFCGTCAAVLEPYFECLLEENQAGCSLGCSFDQQNTAQKIAGAGSLALNEATKDHHMLRGAARN